MQILKMPCQKLINKVEPGFSRLEFNIKEGYTPYAIRVVPNEGRFLINSVESDGRRVPIVGDRYECILSDVFSRTDAPVLVNWGDPTNNLSMEIENFYDSCIDIIIILYEMHHDTPVPHPCIIDEVDILSEYMEALRQHGLAELCNEISSHYGYNH